MTWLLLPSGKYLNLAQFVDIGTHPDGLLVAITATGDAFHHAGKDADAILEALATVRLKVAHRTKH